MYSYYLHNIAVYLKDDSMENYWYLIVNPTSGNGYALKNWKKIELLLNEYHIQFEYSFSEYKKHEIELVHQAVNKGFKKFVNVGGDGTLHHTVNGIMTQQMIKPEETRIAVLPVGTGNDWIKTYGIPKNLHACVSLIAKENYIKQDIGLIHIFNTGKTIYFNNIAGIGFDGFVVKNISKYKRYKRFSYIIGILGSFFTYKLSVLHIISNSKKIKTRSLVTTIGICKFFGNGICLNNNAHPNDGLFDISIVTDFTFAEILKNISKFFNGKISSHPKLKTYRTNIIKIYPESKDSFIQADGELIGSGGFEVTLIPNKIAFIIL